MGSSGSLDEESELVGFRERQAAVMGEQMSNELAYKLKEIASVEAGTVVRVSQDMLVVLREAIAALRSEPPGLRYKATVLWDAKTTVHEGVYPDRQEPAERVKVLETALRKILAYKSSNYTLHIGGMRRLARQALGDSKIKEQA